MVAVLLRGHALLGERDDAVAVGTDSIEIGLCLRQL